MNFVIAHKASVVYDDGMAGLLDAICGAIETSGTTRYRIAQDTGISQTQLCRVISGERGLSIDALETLADYLELEIVMRPKRRRKGR